MRSLPSVAAIVIALLSGCGGGGEPDRYELHAKNCWGTGVQPCSLEQIRERAAALGVVDLGTAAILTAGDGCGAVIDCASAPTPAPVAAVRTPRPTGQPTATPGSSSVATPAPSRTPSPTAIAPTSDPTPAPTGGSSDSCEGIVVKALENKTSLTPAETVCLQATAEGRTSASDPDVQIAAITLFNNRSGGWKGSVEAALKRPALGNAPPLNFAGIKPAYDQGRYSTVLKRARTVWRNLDKGYQLSGKDRTFVVEFACRSAGQLALSGNPPDDGLDWCERWLDVAQRAGSDTGPIEDLISQIE